MFPLHAAKVIDRAAFVISGHAPLPVRGDATSELVNSRPSPPTTGRIDVRRELGGDMHFIRIEDTADRATIEAAMVQLTEKAKRACIESTLREIRQDQDALVDLWLKATEQTN